MGICFQKCIYEKQRQQMLEMLQDLAIFAELNMSISPLVFFISFSII